MSVQTDCALEEGFSKHKSRLVELCKCGSSMFLDVKHICCVLHPASAYMCGFLNLVALTTWRHTKNDSLHLGMVIFIC